MKKPIQLFLILLFTIFIEVSAEDRVNDTLICVKTIHTNPIYLYKNGKADMTTKKEFEINEFMDALEYIGYFKQ